MEFGSNKQQLGTGSEIFSCPDLDFSFPLQKSNRRLPYPMAESPLLDSVEAKIIELHIDHHT
jgi:hypothetical protein